MPAREGSASEMGRHEEGAPHSGRAAPAYTRVAPGGYFAGAAAYSVSV